MISTSFYNVPNQVYICFQKSELEWGKVRYDWVLHMRGINITNVTITLGIRKMHKKRKYDVSIWEKKRHQDGKKMK